MSVLRLVVVADGLNPHELAGALVASGVPAQNIHMSRNVADEALTELGVRCDLPVGRIRVSPEHARDPHVLNHVGLGDVGMGNTVP
ncbi:MAG: hypothetical protein AAB865_00970 [Patescibacteria group bacterium]